MRILRLIRRLPAMNELASHETARDMFATSQILDPFNGSEVYHRHEANLETVEEIENRLKELAHQEMTFIKRRHYRAEKRRRLDALGRLLDAQGENDAKGEAQLDEEHWELLRRLKRLKRGSSRDPMNLPSYKPDNDQSLISDTSNAELSINGLPPHTPPFSSPSASGHTPHCPTNSRPIVSDTIPTQAAATLDPPPPPPPRDPSTQSLPDDLEPEPRVLLEARENLTVTDDQRTRDSVSSVVNNELQTQDRPSSVTNNELVSNQVRPNDSPAPEIPRLSKIVKLSVTKASKARGIIPVKRGRPKKKRDDDKIQTKPQSSKPVARSRTFPCDRVDDNDRSIWRHPVSGVEQYLTCPFCFRVNYTSIWNFMCHMRTHNIFRLKLQLAMLLDEYGTLVGQEYIPLQETNTRQDQPEVIGTIVDDLYSSRDEESDSTSEHLVRTKKPRYTYSHQTEDESSGTSDEDADDSYHESDDDDLDEGVEDSIKVASTSNSRSRKGPIVAQHDNAQQQLQQVEASNQTAHAIHEPREVSSQTSPELRSAFLRPPSSLPSLLAAAAAGGFSTLPGPSTSQPRNIPHKDPNATIGVDGKWTCVNSELQTIDRESNNNNGAREEKNSTATALPDRNPSRPHHDHHHQQYNNEPHNHAADHHPHHLHRPTPTVTTNTITLSTQLNPPIHQTEHPPAEIKSSASSESRSSRMGVVKQFCEEFPEIRRGLEQARLDGRGDVDDGYDEAEDGWPTGYAYE